MNNKISSCTVLYEYLVSITEPVLSFFVLQLEFLRRPSIKELTGKPKVKEKYDQQKG